MAVAPVSAARQRERALCAAVRCCCREEALAEAGAARLDAAGPLLARSTSALYALRGLSHLLAASDPVRYRPFIVFIGATNGAFGLALGVIGVHAAVVGTSAAHHWPLNR